MSGEELIRREGEAEEDDEGEEDVAPAPRFVLPPRPAPRVLPPAEAPTPETEARSQAAESPAEELRPLATHAPADRLEHSLAPGERGEAPAQEPLEAYEELEVIGTGGVGVVTRARHRVTGAEVAVKRLRRPTDRRRFLAEADAIAALDHPGIVKLLEVVRSPGEEAPLALVLELVEGTDLEHWVAREGPMELAQATEIALQIVAALAHAHARGVIHRDLKPSNVLLDREGRVRLTDFGLALTVEAQLSVTPTGASLGTPSYMAPEQLEGAHEVDALADVYGLGATLYRLLTGRSPRVIRERYLPDEVADLVLRCVEEDPQARCTLDELGRLLQGAHERATKDPSGVHGGLERAIERVQRELSLREERDSGQRLIAAVVGLANLELLPLDATARIRSRLQLGDRIAVVVEDLIDDVLVAASRERDRARLLRDAHAILSAALSRSPQLRGELRRLAEGAREVQRAPASTRLSRVVERLVGEGALEPGDLRALAKRSGPARVVLEAVLTRLRLRAEEATDGLAGARRARAAIRELAIQIPEWATRLEEEDLALALREAAERNRSRASEDPADDEAG